MSDFSTFDKLVQELNLDERKDLLNRIEHTVTISQEPLISDIEETANFDLVAEYQALSLIEKIILFFKGLFSGKKREEVLEGVLLKQLKKRISHETPKLVDFRYSLFLEGMKIECENLLKNAMSFKEAINLGMGTEKARFLAFLASFTMEKIHEMLITQTDPFKIMDEYGFKNEKEVKSEMEQRFTRILSQIKDDDREKIYLDWQALYYLHKFCNFPFENIIDRFGYYHFKGRLSCPFSDLEKRLVSLAEILISAKIPPSVSATKALFLFYLQKNINTQGFDLENELKNRLSKAEEALVGIRIFNKRVPLLSILKIIKDKYNFKINGIKGGEDWFLLFRNYWSQRLKQAYKEFYKERRTHNVMNKALTYLNLRELPKIKYYDPSNYKQKEIIRHWRTLGFLSAFYKNVFNVKLNRSLKILLINAEFYKEDNRVEYTDTYNFINSINDKIFIFEKKFSPQGEFGGKIEEIMEQNIPESLQEKNITTVLKIINDEVLTLVDKAIFCLSSLTNILNGVLYGEVGGKYDTLSNIGYIGGRENQMLLKEWENVLTLVHEAAQILKEMKSIE